MDSLQDLLGKYSRKEPPEIAAVKEYIREHFNVESGVSLQGDRAIIITVHSASLANTLRYHLVRIQTAAHTSKRLVLRIGS
jgi:hypothetical protein